jgi:hypothetical protein
MPEFRETNVKEATKRAASEALAQMLAVTPVAPEGNATKQSGFRFVVLDCFVPLSFRLRKIRNQTAGE